MPENMSYEEFKQYMINSTPDLEALQNDANFENQMQSLYDLYKNNTL
jgi:hypothetical protein